MKRHYTLRDVLTHLGRAVVQEEFVQLLRDIQGCRVPFETVDQHGFEVEGVFDHGDLEEVVKKPADWFSFEEYSNGMPRKKQIKFIDKENDRGEWEKESYECKARLDKCIMSMSSVHKLKKELASYNSRAAASSINIDKVINECELSESQRNVVMWLFKEYIENPERTFSSEEIFKAIDYCGHDGQMSSLFKRGTSRKILRYLKNHKGYWAFRVPNGEG